MMVVDLQQRVYDLCRDYMLGRLDAVLAAIDDDVDFVIYAPADIVPPHTRHTRPRGKAALASVLLKVQSQFEYLSYRPAVINGDADVVAVAILAQLRHRTSGEVVPLFIANFVRFREGRIVEMREFVNRADGIEQLFARKNGFAK